MYVVTHASFIQWDKIVILGQVCFNKWLVPGPVTWVKQVYKNCGIVVVWLCNNSHTSQHVVKNIQKSKCKDAFI